MLVLTLRTEIPLSAPDESFGFVTWLDATIRKFDSATPAVVATARVAMIHVADAMNRGATMHDVLDADSEDLLALHAVFFDDEQYLREEFHTGIGWNVMYFDQIEVAEAWSGRKIEEAIVRRVVDTWGEGCALAVLPVGGAAETTRWSAIGFETARDPAGIASNFMYLDLALEQHAVIAADDAGDRFQIVDAS